MANDDPTSRRAGTSALVITVPEAEPLVGRWRARYDRAAAEGVAAHVTVLHPFLDASRIDAGVLLDLGRLIGAHPPFEVRFTGCGRFPGALYLVPEPERPLRALTESVVARWPGCPPYGGRFGDAVPHLTVAQGQQPAVYDTVESAVAGGLPLACRVSRVRLVVFDGTAWRERAAFALSVPPSPTAGARGAPTPG